jgi:hypothetical protein
MVRKKQFNMNVAVEFKEMLERLKKDTEKARGIRPSDVDITAELTKKQLDKFARRVLFG